MRILTLTLFTAVVASAQTQSLNCSVTTAVGADAVVDGLTERVGDLVVRCTGGVPTAARASIPTANISVTLNTLVTSRVLAGTWTDALLLLDEPGPSSQFACDTSSGICGALGDGAGSGKYYGPGPSGTTGNNKNVFQGQLTSSNVMSWIAVPIDPPGPNGTRVIRIANMRANANRIGSPSLNSAASTIVASFAITSSAAIQVTGSIQTVAFVRDALATSIRNANDTADITAPVAVSGCASSQLTKVATLRFGERFASALTRRNIATTPTLTSDLAPQNNLSVIYQTQTGFYNPNLPDLGARGNLGYAGLADSGARLKAVFRNLPPGVTVYVNTSDASGKARLTNNETGDFVSVSLTNPFPLAIQNGSSTAVWEVLGDDPASIEQFDFGVYVIPAADVVNAGGITVNRSVAPNSTFSVPRFADTSSPSSLVSFSACSGPAAPGIDKLSPASATAGAAGFTLGVAGANFVTGATVQWNGLSLTTTFGSATQLTAVVPASLLAQPGAANVSVLNRSGSRSNTVIFPVDPATTPFKLSVPSLTFQFAGGNQAQTQQIQIGSIAGPPLPFGAAASLVTPAATNWLRVDPVTAVTPAILNVTVNPAGLRPGIYLGSITISLRVSAFSKTTERDAVGDAVVTVTLVLSDDRLSFTFLTGGPRPAAKMLTVAALSATNARFFASSAVTTPSGGGWLALSPADTNAPTSLAVSIDPAGLAPGIYSGLITLNPADSTGAARQVPVALTVLATPNQRLSFSYQTGAAAPSPQSFTSNVGGGFINSEAFSDGSWLSVSPSGGTSPVSFSCSVNPAGLSAGTYSGLVVITDSTTATVYVTQVTLTVASGGPITQIISHIADGARWKTTIILLNLDSVAAPFTLNFWRDDGTAMFATVNDTIPTGGSRTIETGGIAGALSTGWAEIISTQAIGGTAIFRDQNLAQEAAVPLLSGAAARLLLPFDTGGLSLGVALANPSLTQDIVVTRTLRNGQGQVITSDSLALARHGHTAFVLSNPSAKPEDQRGVLELSSNAGPVFALGIRGNNGAFTSIEALSPQEVKTKVISHIADGARWKTTIILVNTDTVPVQFTVNFWKDDGSPFLRQVVDAIPVGGARTIETDGLAATLSTGWAEVLSAQSIGGTAIFRDQTLRQEAAVPLLTSGGTKLLLPFDRGLDLGVALANSSPAQDASITRTLRNEQGVVFSSDVVSLSRRAHTAFGLTNPSARPEDQRGVVELSSSVEFFSLGIRGNNGAFTSIRALSK